MTWRNYSFTFRTGGAACVTLSAHDRSEWLKTLDGL
jgi:hypothetical protein